MKSNTNQSVEACGSGSCLLAPLREPSSKQCFSRQPPSQGRKEDPSKQEHAKKRNSVIEELLRFGLPLRGSLLRTSLLRTSLLQGSRFSKPPRLREHSSKEPRLRHLPLRQLHSREIKATVASVRAVSAEAASLGTARKCKETQLCHRGVASFWPASSGQPPSKEPPTR